MPEMLQNDEWVLNLQDSEETPADSAGKPGITLDDVLDDENIKEAIAHLMEKPDSAGADGIKLSRLNEYWNTNGRNITERIRDCSYKPGIVRQREIVNKDQKKRMVSNFNAVDRLLMRAITQVFNEQLDSIFSINAFAYRPEKGVTAAVEQAASYLEAGFSWVAELDIHDYFNTIDQDLLMTKLSGLIQDRALISLISEYMKCDVDNGDELTTVTKGLITGSPISPILSNIYLNEFDHLLDSRNCRFVRYGDDVNIYCRTYEDALQEKKHAEAYLTGTLKLEINEQKSGVFNGLTRRFLGYSFQKKQDHVYVQQLIRNKPGIFHDWHSTAIEKVNKDYHLINEGILNKKDFNVLFENAEHHHYIPVEAVGCINIYSNITFGSDFFLFANRQKLEIAIFDKYGNKAGSFVHAARRYNMKVEIAQIQLLNDPIRRLDAGKKLENANIHNMRSNLKYYSRRLDNQTLEENTQKLTEYLQQVNEAKDIDELLLIEARARQVYYQSFNCIIMNGRFTFTTRTKRPPKDPINSMISFGNTLLYQRLATEIKKSPLDIRFAVLHSSNTRAESLNLDLADLFKPILVDRTIFTLVNRHMLDADEDFIEVEDNGIYIGNDEKKKFIQVYEQKLYQKITVNGITRTYDTIMKNEIYKYRSFIEGEKPYHPFKYKE